MKGKMIIKILVDNVNEQIGVIDVQSNADVFILEEGREFLALVFKQLYEQYSTPKKKEEKW